jgi:hypothetical protein
MTIVAQHYLEIVCFEVVRCPLEQAHRVAK